MYLKYGMIALALCGTLAAEEDKQVPEVSWEEQVDKIDQQISTFRELQEKVRKNAKRNANDALRWQSQKENFTDARRAWDRAAKEKQKIQEIDDQIQNLESRKENILKEHCQK